MSVLQELQRHAVFALVGLIAFFPIFNQVAETSQDALRDADHKAKFKDFIKSWDDIPEDEKLSYWDGKSRPPGQQGDFDEDRIDKDGNFQEPDQPPPSDRDGDGVPDADDPDPDDARVRDNETAEKARTEVVELHKFVGSDQPVATTGSGDKVSVAQGGDDEEWVLQHAWVDWDIEGFSGRYTFRLSEGTEQKWSESSPNGQIQAINHDDEGPSEPFEVGSDMEFVPNYEPLAGTSPESFVITVYAEYRVYSE